MTPHASLDKTHKVSELSLGAAEEAHAQARGKGLHAAPSLQATGSQWRGRPASTSMNRGVAVLRPPRRSATLLNAFYRKHAVSK